eukprot:CAMPEP_0167788424 /NCGR_PEP_ID=MMETSP0111_2-20121227/10033_1 /TAXON_ID=91324 /ORGANISM="Lotharella globosa, Strain CCCM811" /LENGTH=307 /DNA_ID=CAMNT_0007680301 /DNA_START=25 /DNA_END=948 /DNA_ORIENTATION=-
MASQSPLAMQEDDLKLLLAARTHIGNENVNAHMAKYVWRRRQEGGVHIINIGKTWEKLMLAARIIVAIENPDDVVAVSGTQTGQRAVYKFAQHTGCSYIGSRYTPGCFTNQIQKKYMEPRLLIVTDPLVDHQPIKEAAYANIPVIAFCDTNAITRYIDVVIPCNNRSKHSIALMYWLLAREVNRLRGAISRQEPWGVMVDLFMFRPVHEEEEKKADDAAQAAEALAEAEAAEKAVAEKKVETAFAAPGAYAELKADNSAFAAADDAKAAVEGTIAPDFAATVGEGSWANVESEKWGDSAAPMTGVPQ